MFERVIYTGPTFSDREILRVIPAELASVLVVDNGVVAYSGGFHIRGACSDPQWHSLRSAWSGPHALSKHYDAVRATDVPFAQDALGDQYLLRDDVVHHLNTETGELASRRVALALFLQGVRADPVGTLSLEPLLAFEADGGVLQPGQLLSVYPPYCVNTETRRSFRAVAALDRLGFLASLARQMQHLPDGAEIELKLIPPAV
jgi:hypothetical protein